MGATLCCALMVLVASTGSAEPVRSQERAVKLEAAKPPTSVAAPSGRPSPSDWWRQVWVILNRNKQYPLRARSKREHGTAVLVFTINRQGGVTSARIARSSGSAALDGETLALVHRVSFPPPPEQMTDRQLKASILIRYDTGMWYPCGMLGISTGANCL
jgi:periplasmic protein TonB